MISLKRTTEYRFVVGNAIAKFAQEVESLGYDGSRWRNVRYRTDAWKRAPEAANPERMLEPAT